MVDREHGGGGGHRFTGGDLMFSDRGHTLLHGSLLGIEYPVVSSSHMANPDGVELVALWGKINDGVELLLLAA